MQVCWKLVDPLYCSKTTWCSVVHNHTISAWASKAHSYMRIRKKDSREFIFPLCQTVGQRYILKANIIDFFFFHSQNIKQSALTKRPIVLQHIIRTSSLQNNNFQIIWQYRNWKFIFVINSYTNIIYLHVSFLLLEQALQPDGKTSVKSKFRNYFNISN